MEEVRCFQIYSEYTEEDEWINSYFEIYCNWRKLLVEMTTFQPFFIFMRDKIETENSTKKIEFEHETWKFSWRWIEIECKSFKKDKHCARMLE